MTEAKEKGKLANKIVRATVMVGVAHIIFKFAGLLQSIIMGHYIPAAPYEAIYSFAFKGCILGLFFTLEEVIGPAFLPIFVREKEQHGEKHAWGFARGILTIHMLLLILLVSMLLIFPEEIAKIVTLKSWNETSNPEQYALAVSNLRKLAPALFGLSLGSTTYMLLNSYKRFFLAAFGDAVWKLCAIAFVGVGIALLGGGLDMLIIGLLVGSLAKLATHLLGLRDKIKLLIQLPRFDKKLLREFSILALPLIIGIVFAKVRDLFNNISVLSTLSESGLIQANEYGKRLYDAISVILPYTIAIALFPFFCDMFNRENRQELADTLTGSGRMVLSILIPAACIVAALSTPITQFLFQGGEFGDTAVKLTSISMSFYIICLPAAALEAMLMQAFFADRRTVAISVTGIIFSYLSMHITYFGIVQLGLHGAWAIALVAAGFTLTRTLKCVTLILLMRRSAPVFPLMPTLSFLLRTSVLGLACAAGAFFAARAVSLSGFVMPSIPGLNAERTAAIPTLLTGGLATVVILIPGFLLLRIDEPRMMISWALKRRRNKSTGTQ